MFGLFPPLLLVFAVVLSICKKLGYEVNAITFDYNQRHKVELNCAKWQAEYFQCISHRIFKLDFFGGSSLTDNIDVPKNKNVKNIDSASTLMGIC